MNHEGHEGHEDNEGRPAWELCRTIIGSAIRVHEELGPGLLETAYSECLAHELATRNIPFEREKPMPVRYRRILLNCRYRIDLLVDDRVVVEIKAVDRLLPIHEAQLLTYMKLAKRRVGLLVNFNVRTLKHGIRRLVL